MAKLLIVEDESSLLHSIQIELSRIGHVCSGFETAEQAIRSLEEVSPDLALFDIRLPDLDGVELIRRIKGAGHEFPIIVMTGFASVSNAVAAMKEGAVDYIEKPIDLEQLNLVIQRNLDHLRMSGRLELLERTHAGEIETAEIIGRNPEFVRVLEVAKRVAAPAVDHPTDLPTILLLGETGTGKDLLAGFIHQNSPASKGPFVQLNCAAFPRDLIESELFGHEKGAFTDARATKKGLLEIAGDGTVFLDEVGELPVDLQAKLLSALESRLFRRIGGTRPRRFNARIVAATNADLATRIKEGAFREDLFYRLNTFTITLPPLRDRGDDVRLLADHFLMKFSRKYRKRPAVLSPEAVHRLQAYPWPGNIRELSHVLENVTLLSDAGIIRAHHLGLSSSDSKPVVSTGDSVEIRFDFYNPDCTLERVERQLIDHVLSQTSGNVSEAAKLLGVSRGALRRRLEHFQNEETI